MFVSIATAVPLSAQIGLPSPTGIGFGSSVTGAPYSATQTTERIQTLADGTHITQPGPKTVTYRDSAGRTRTEFTFPVPPGARPNGQSPPVRITILDPVAGFRYELNSTDKVALRTATPVPRSANGQPRQVLNAQGAATGLGLVVNPNGVLVGNGAAANRPKSTSESLGTQMIEGLNADGTRRTTTWPVGSIGNDREIVVTNENWFSKQLQVEVLTKTSDPRMGESTTKLTNISLVEPDPALFIPPGDYTVKDAIKSAGGPPVP